MNRALEKTPEMFQAMEDALMQAPPLALHVAMMRKNAVRYAAVLRLIEPYLGASGTKEILDYGCGFPFMVKMLALMNQSAWGYEPYAEPVHLDMARRFALGDRYCTALPEDRQFDLVLLVDVIEHLSVLRPTMTDVIRRMKPGGLLAISTPNGMRFDIWWAYFRRGTAHPTSLQNFLETENNYTYHQREFTMAELRTAMSYYKLEVVCARIEDTFAGLGDRLRYRNYFEDADNNNRGLKNRLREILRHHLPAGWRNNLLLVVRKPLA